MRQYGATSISRWSDIAATNCINIRKKARKYVMSFPRVEHDFRVSANLSKLPLAVCENSIKICENCLEFKSGSIHAFS